MKKSSCTINKQIQKWNWSKYLLNLSSGGHDENIFTQHFKDVCWFGSPACWSESTLWREPKIWLKEDELMSFNHCLENTLQIQDVLNKIERDWRCNITEGVQGGNFCSWKARLKLTREKVDQRSPTAVLKSYWPGTFRSSPLQQHLGQMEGFPPHIAKVYRGLETKLVFGGGALE